MPMIMKTVWSGLQGSPGTTTWTFNDASNSGATTSSAGCTAAAAAQRVFFDTIKAYFPSSLTLSWDGQAFHVDDATGVLTAAQAYTPPASVVGTAATSYAGPAGASVRWNTAGAVNGRLLKGRTYIVPIVTSGYDSVGTLHSTFIALLLGAANAYTAAGVASSTWRQVVWHRPQGGGGGQSWLVDSAAVKDTAAVLTSRRD